MHGQRTIRKSAILLSNLYHRVTQALGIFNFYILPLTNHNILHSIYHQFEIRSTTPSMLDSAMAKMTLNSLTIITNNVVIGQKIHAYPTEG